MLGIACVLLYLGIVKKFEPLLLVPIAFGMLITNLPGANMFHEIFFAGGHIHWDLIGGQPVTASLLADLHSQGVAENVLAPYIQQLRRRPEPPSPLWKHSFRRWCRRSRPLPTTA